MYKTKTLLLMFAVLLVCVLAISLTLFLTRTEEKYVNMSDDWNERQGVGLGRVSEILDDHHENAHEFLSTVSKEYKYPHIELGNNKDKFAMDQMRLESLNQGERLKYENYRRINNLDQQTL